MKEKSKNTNQNTSQNIKKFNLWEIFKFIVAILFTVLIIYKLAISDLSFDFSKFDFNSLLTLILSLFAIGLSIVFYFKATETSNLFYDITYKFTKEISNILGRIEAGFGEKLQNLDKGYSGLLNKMEKTVSSPKDIEETKTDKQEVEQTLHNEIRERNNIIQNLIERSQLEQKEKEDIKKSLFEKEKMILKFERELRLLQHKLDRQKNSAITKNIPDRLLTYLRRNLLRLDLHNEEFNRKIAKSLFLSLHPTKVMID